MKRLRWPLQRLLEVTAQRERALRLELFRLSQEIAAGHRELFRRQASTRSALVELAGQTIQERLPHQREFMRLSAAQKARLDRLREELRGLKTRRSEKVAEFTKARASRQTLERLREEAFLRHSKQMLKEDQKELDESSQIAFTRDLIGQRAGDRE